MKFENCHAWLAENQAQITLITLKARELAAKMITGISFHYAKIAMLSAHTLGTELEL
jgi:hypothetical protein